MAVTHLTPRLSAAEAVAQARVVDLTSPGPHPYALRLDDSSRAVFAEICEALRTSLVAWPDGVSGLVRLNARAKSDMGMAAVYEKGRTLFEQYVLECTFTTCGSA